MKEQILSDHQLKLLEYIGQNQFLTQTFYLSGGTALAGFYLFHRYSEDLDFFSENEFDVLQIDVFVKQLQKKLPISRVDFQQSFNRNLFFLQFADNDVVKIEYTYYPFPRIEKGQEAYAIQIDSPVDIATNKLFSIYQRTQARDYIDLYLLMKEKGYSIEELVQKVRQKFDWHVDLLQLGTQLMRVTEPKDYPRMILPLDTLEWQSFFLNEAKKLKDKILE